MRVSVRAEEHHHHQVRGHHDPLRDRLPHHLHGLPLLHRPRHRQVEAEFIQAAEGGRGKLQSVDAVDKSVKHSRLPPSLTRTFLFAFCLLFLSARFSPGPLYSHFR